jgi:ABC-type multidrug transport system fused ATPase/permease subunit
LAKFTERMSLLRLLRHAGAGLMIALSSVLVAQALLPAAAALATAALIDALGGDFTLPLLAVGGILLAGQLGTVAFRALRLPVVGRIDAAHRAEMASLASATATVEVIERPEVQDLLRTAAADPMEWVEKTPGQGSVAQLSLLVRHLGWVSSAAVVTAWSPWLVPGLVFPALLVGEISRRQWIRHFYVWMDGIAHHRRYLYWGEQATSVAEAKELRVFGLRDWVVERHNKHMRAHLDPVWADDQVMAIGRWRQFAATVLPLGAVFAAVAYGAAVGDGSVGLASAVLAASWGVFSSVSSMGPLVTVEGALPGVRSAQQLRRELASSGTAGMVARGAPTWQTPKGDPPLVRFESVGFTYPGTALAVLDGVELSIAPGEKLAIVGLNGAGKSTLVKLLCGLYTPTAGRITADGEDIAAIGPTAWRTRLAVVFQDFVKYRLSLLDNIALGRPRQVDWAAAEAAAADVGLTDVVARLPSGWDTPLSPSRNGGVDLSGGQWQQVVLARALYAVRTGATILVLDEPTAHLDVRSELELFGRLSDLSKGVTTILISHRLSTVRRSDRIVLLHAGGVAEFGSHDVLMARGGRYAEMYTIQAERFTSGFEDRIEEGELT